MSASSPKSSRTQADSRRLEVRSPSSLAAESSSQRRAQDSPRVRRGQGRRQKPGATATHAPSLGSNGAQHIFSNQNRQQHSGDASVHHRALPLATSSSHAQTLSLPKDGWELHHDPSSGYPYYYHPPTGASAWSLPPGANVVVSSGAVNLEKDLPSGWHAGTDENGSIYYHNQFTGEWSWEFPEAGVTMEAHESLRSTTHSAMERAQVQAGSSKLTNASTSLSTSQPISTPYSDDEITSSSSSAGESYDESGSSAHEDTSDNDSDFSDAEGGVRRRSRHKKRKKNGERMEGVLDTFGRATETIKDSLKIVQRRTSKVIQDAIPKVVEIGHNFGSLSLETANAVYTEGSQLLVKAYEAAQQYLLSGGVHTEESARRVFQGDRGHFASTSTSFDDETHQRSRERKSRPSPLRVIGGGSDNPGDGIFVEVPLGSPTSGSDQMQHANRALSEIGRSLAGVAISPSSRSAV